MLKFFRKIRQKLLAEGKFKGYTLYAIGEILLVVVGILIALQINNWNEGRKDRAAEVELLSNLKEEFVENQEALFASIPKHETNVAKIRKTISLVGPDAEAIDPEVFNDLIGNLAYLPSYQPSD